MPGRLMAVWLTIEVVASLAIPVGLDAQTRKGELSLRVAAIEAPQVGKAAGFWLVIRNETDRVRFLCQKGWDYSHGDTHEPDVTLGAQTGIHSCLDRRDGFLLMPKESRVDRVELELRTTNRERVLSVNVWLVERSLDDATTVTDTTASWQGTVAEAIVFGQKVGNGKLE